MDEQFATLAKRPVTEVMIERYEQMQARIRERLSADVGLVQWINRNSLGGSGCSDFSEILEAENVTLDRWTSEEALPDARWDRAVQIVTEITRDYGFGAPEVVIDRPGNHEIVGFGQYGARYVFGTRANTILRVSTGCHLPAKVHPNERQPERHQLTCRLARRRLWDASWSRRPA